MVGAVPRALLLLLLVVVVDDDRFVPSSCRCALRIRRDGALGMIDDVSDGKLIEGVGPTPL